MAIESFKFKIHAEEKRTQDILHAENVEKHLCDISESLFQKDLEVGSGNFSRVYRDPEAGIVYKKEKPLSNPKNNVHEEASFLTELIGFSDEVITPFPVVSFVADLKRDKDSKAVRQSVLAMQEIKGFSIDKMLPKNPGDKPEQDFPETFNPDTFFPALKKFVQKMHVEKNIYHRDLFDRNVMIDQKTGKPVLIDFGDSVRFDEKFAEEGESDAYGKTILFDNEGNKIPRKDYDLDNIDALEAAVRKFLTENNNLI